MRAAARPALRDAGDQRQAAQDQLRPSSASPTLATTKKIRLHVILLCSVHRQPCWAGRMAAGLRAVARAQWGVCGRAGVSDDCAAAAHSRKRCVAIPPRGVCRPPRGLSALHHFLGTKVAWAPLYPPGYAWCGPAEIPQRLISGRKAGTLRGGQSALWSPGVKLPQRGPSRRVASVPHGTILGTWWAGVAPLPTLSRNTHTHTQPCMSVCGHPPPSGTNSHSCALWVS